MISSDTFSADPEEIDRELMEGLHPYEGWSHDPCPSDQRKAQS
jgi:hypothetical protein